MFYTVEPYRWEVKEQKAMGMLPAIYKKIHEEMPILIYELIAHVNAERYVSGERELTRVDMGIIVAALETILGIDRREYRLPPEKLRVRLQKPYRIPSFEERRSPADSYHFLRYVRDLIKKDKQLFNAMRFYTTL